jgi:hypothetical protein
MMTPVQGKTAAQDKMSARHHRNAAVLSSSLPNLPPDSTATLRVGLNYKFGITPAFSS